MMSSRKSSILESPQTTIGAQDLLCIGSCSKSGFLRKQGTLERLFKCFKWRELMKYKQYNVFEAFGRQKFVVLSRGCIYVFKDELATHPQTSFTLKLFVRISRHDDGRVRWSFSLLPVDQRQGKTLVFACISEPERKEWMKFVKAEMVKAHKITENSTGESRDEYVYLEKPVLVDEPANSSTLISKLPVDEEDIDVDADDPGGEKDYTTIDDSMLDARPPMPEPVTQKKAMKPAFKPAAPIGNTASKLAAQKKASSLPASINPNAVLRTAFEYKGSDRDEIEILLSQRPEGTYLVRKSRSDGKEVLSVNIDGCLKEFKIYTKDSSVTINNTDYFSSVEELIQYYIDHPLPKKATKLYRAYSVIDPRYIN